MGQRTQYDRYEEEPQVYTQADEPLTDRILRALKSAVGLGVQDINLPDEREDTPQRQREYRGEIKDDQLRKSDNVIKSLQGFGERMNRQELLRQLKENTKREKK